MRPDGQAAYAASKAGIAGLTLPAARDLARSGIRVARHRTRPIATPMMLNLRPDIQKALGDSVPSRSAWTRAMSIATGAAHDRKHEC